MIYSNLCFNQMDLKDFSNYMIADNCIAVTINLKPNLWNSEIDVIRKLMKYCKERDTEYYLVSERGTNNNNLHFHGFFLLNYNSKNLQNWVNKNLGKWYVSPSYGDPQKWYRYIHKTILD